MPRALLTRAVTLFTVLLLALAPAMAQGRRTGTIDGAQTLHVRSGPGVEHDSIGLLHRGDTVEVTSIDGNWARIRHAGRDGWVHSSFVALQATLAREVSAATPTPTPSPLAEESATAISEIPTAEIIAPAAAPATGEVAGDLRENVERILTLTEAMHHDLERRRNSLPATGRMDDGIGLQSGIGLLVLGAVIGFFIGTVIGRQQERRGRSRVRF